MKTVILAAGEGRRLAPLTNRRPKPMLPVAGKPLLEHVVQAAVDAGSDEIVLVVGYERDRIQTHFGDGDDWGIDIEYAVQEKQLGTGHAVLQAEPYVDDEFVVLNGDRMIESSVVHDVAVARETGDQSAMAVTRVADPSEYGVVDLDGDYVRDIVEKPRAGAAVSQVINAGVYGLGGDIFDAIRETSADSRGEVGITDALVRLAEQGQVRAVRYRGLWVDVSHLWDVPTVTANALDRAAGSRDGTVETGAVVADATHVRADSRIGANATVRRGTSIGPNVSVGANAVLSRSVVLADAVVGDGTVLKDSVVAENATLGPNVTVGGGPADVTVGDTVHRDVPLGAVVGDNARVGGGATLAPGTVIGDDAVVEAGVTVSGHVPPGTEVRRG